MCSILFIDDNKVWLDIMERELAWNSSIKIYCAYDGKQGIESIERFKPEVIVTDIVMPVAGGISVIEHARRIEGYTPLIYAVTGAPSESLTKILQGLHVDLQSIRPVDAREVAANILRLLDVKKEDGKGAEGDIERRVSPVLRRFEVPGYLTCYRVTEDVLLELWQLQDELIVLGSVYQAVGEKRGMSPASVEGNVRFFIKSATKQKSLLFKQLFSKNKRLPNALFLNEVIRYTKDSKETDRL